jgi:hypothetical protein
MSGGPRAIWERFFQTVLLPAIQQYKAQFDAAIVSAIAHFSKEEFSGPVTATVVFGAGATDALMKLSSRLFQGQYDVSQLSLTDWVMIGFAFAIIYNGGTTSRD